MRFLHTLSFKVFVGSLIILIVLFGLYSHFVVRFHHDELMSYVFHSADRISDVIKNSTHYSMLLNRKEDVHQIISMIGREPGVDGIRIYNKRGEIILSTNKAEEHTTVDMNAEACYVCHDQEKPLESLPITNRSRIYTAPDGKRILGLINPIRNELSCSVGECHAHPAEKTVLGVLDIRMSLDQVDASLAKAQNTMIQYAILTVAGLAFISVLFFYLTVHRPVQRLMEGTRQLSAGNLDHAIIVQSRDEIGGLAESFNNMTRSLKRAQDENERWSQVLEQRIHEKTEELRRIHDQILQIEKMASLGKLSATVAHELNNPLEGILTYAKLTAKKIRKGSLTPDQLQAILGDIDIIAQESQRCGNIVKNLLLFSRRQVGEFSVVPVRQSIEKATQLMQHHCSISNVVLESKYDAEDITLMCDENQIEQALIALFVNSVEAMPGGGTLSIRVSCQPDGGDVHITVSDNGIGISNEDLPHIFEPFYTTKKQGKGVGLGLSVVYGIVERHGGTVSVQSELGKGTTFTLMFPNPERHAHHATAAPDHQPAKRD